MHPFFLFCLGWYAFGVVAWWLFCISEGRLTVGDLLMSFLLGPTGPILPLIRGMYYGMKMLESWSRIVIWQRKS